MLNKYLLILLYFISYSVEAQFKYGSNEQNIHNRILSIDRGINRSTFIGGKDNYATLLWLKSYDEFIKSIIPNDVKNTAIHNIEQNLKDIILLQKNTPFYFYYRADLNLFLSYLYFKQNLFFNSLQCFFKAKSLIKEQQKDYPTFRLVNKQKLIVNIVNNFISKQVGFDFMFKQSITDNTALLKMYLKLSKGVIFRELKLIGVLMTSIQPDLDLDFFVKELLINKEFASNGPIETIATFSLYKKIGKNKENLYILKSADSKGFASNLNLLNLWYGNELLNNKSDSSIIYINKFLNRQKSINYTAYAQFKASLYWFINGEKRKSDSLNSLILKQLDIVTTDEDKQAVYEIKNAENWKKELVLARLLFDGGNYEYVQQLLSGIDVSNYNKEQLLEYNYRMGRLYDKMNNINKASLFYNKVINSGLDFKYYYPSYSAYYLGKMYAKSGDIENANTCYDKCLNLDTPIYKHSIRKKAYQSIK